MVISTQANLIPYDRGQYPMLPQRQAGSLVISEDMVERHYRFQRSPTAKIAADDSEGIYGKRYDSNQCWQYAHDYQVGERIDIYA